MSKTYSQAKRKGIMLCYPLELKRLEEKWQYPIFTQPKLDGERCRYKDNQLLSSSENEIFSIPHIEQALKNAPINWPELDGELYLHGLDFDSIHSIVSRTVNFHPNLKTIQYHIFDIIDEYPQFERFQQLNILKDFFPSQIKIVPFKTANNFEQLWSHYNLYLSQGYEGIILRHQANLYVRNRSPYIMKFKPKKDDYYEIIGFKEEIDKNGKGKNSLGSFICKGTDQTEFAVGSGLTERERTIYWADQRSLIGKLLHVQYQHITPGKNVPRFPVFMEVVDYEKKND